MKKNLFGLAALLLAAANVSACKVAASSLEQQTSYAEEIFIATLIEARLIRSDDSRAGSRIEGRFQIGKILKGRTQPKEITLTTGLGRGDCGVAMFVSAKYVIFKGQNDTGIGSPSGTHVIEDFQEDALVGEIQSITHQRKSKSTQK
jgi:hypothetical protein